MISRQWNAILQIRASRIRECLRFEGLPLLDGVQLAVLEDPGAAAGAAEALFRALRQRIGILVASAGAVHAEQCGGPQGRSCMGYGEPDCRCLLIVVTGSGPIASVTEQEMLAWKRGGPGVDIVLPVLPGGSNPSTVLGPKLDKTNVIFHHGHAEDTADTLIQQSGLGDAQRRLFISYRRTDTRELADQLFDSFSRAGYQVFLDRFSGTPGRLFPDELCEEIVDKGVVLVLESDGLRNSPWTLTEVGFAFLFRIGLLALNVDSAPPLGLITSRDRHKVQLNSARVLDKSNLESVIRFVRSEYPRQMLARRLFLEALLRMGLKKHYLIPQAAGAGIFEVIGGGTKYIIGLAERAPSIKDVRRVATSAAKGSCRLVLGPHQFLAPERRRDFDWLLETANVRVMGEGEITKKSAAIARGSMNP